MSLMYLNRLTVVSIYCLVHICDIWGESMYNNSTKAFAFTLPILCRMVILPNEGILVQVGREQVFGLYEEDFYFWPIEFI